VEAAESEVVECGRALVRIIGKPIDLFSFPFGRVDNIRNETRQAISAAGYVALFSSHGGVVGPRTDPYDIPRMGSSYESSALYCLLQIEALRWVSSRRHFGAKEVIRGSCMLTPRVR